MQLSGFVQPLVECKSQSLLGSSTPAHLTKINFLTLVREKNTSDSKGKKVVHTQIYMEFWDAVYLCQDFV